MIWYHVVKFVCDPFNSICFALQNLLYFKSALNNINLTAIYFNPRENLTSLIELESIFVRSCPIFGMVQNITFKISI